jgi:MoxR-like ATPase
VREPAEELAELRAAASDEISKLVLSHDQAIESTLIAALAGGHVLLEARRGRRRRYWQPQWPESSVCRSSACSSHRTRRPPRSSGENVIVAGERRFEPGIVFTNVLLADEINRTPPRTQAALLEAMQEGHVTVDGRSIGSHRRSS